MRGRDRRLSARCGPRRCPVTRAPLRSDV